MLTRNFNADILDKYPFPLAGTYGRFIDQREASAQHAALLSLFEVLLKYVTATALNQYLQAGGADAALATAVAALKRPSLGHWAGLLRQVLAWRDTQKLPADGFPFPQLADLYNKAGPQEAGVELLRKVSGGGATKVSLRQLIDLFVEYRNKQAHGAGSDTTYYAEMVPLVQRALEEMLKSIGALATHDLIYLESVGLLPNDRRSLMLLPLMSDRPRLRPQEYVTAAPEDNRDPQRLYLLMGETLAGAITLHPLLVFIPSCAVCRAAQVGVLNGANEKSAEYLCYACGHTNTIPELADDVAAFLARFNVELPPAPQKPVYDQAGTRPFPSGPWTAVHGAKPDATGGRVLGREDALDELDRLTAGVGALAVTGISGIGKSTLAAAWIERLNASGRRFEGYCWFQLRAESTVADLYALLDAQLHPDARQDMPALPDDQANAIAGWLRRNPLLLVLDDFENVMAPGETSVMPGWDMLLQNAVGDVGSSLVLLTSFELPLTTRGDRPADLPLKNLSTKAATELLKLRAGRSGAGLNDALAERAVRVVGGHPGAIGLLGGLLSDGLDLGELLDDPEFQAYRVQEVTARLIRVHESRLSKEEWGVLWAVALLEPPAVRRAIAAVLPPLAAAAGTTTPTGPAILGLLAGLVRKSLLEKVDAGWTMQAILREYFGEVHAAGADALQQANAAAMEFYLAEPLPDQPQSAADLAPLLSAFRYAVAAGEYGRAFAILYTDPAPGNPDLTVSGQLELWSAATALADLGQLLLPRQRGGKPLLADDRQQALVLSCTGDALRVLGQSNRSLEYLQSALRLYRAAADRSGEARTLSRLGSTARQSGDLKGTADYARQAVTIFNSLGDMAGEADSLNLQGFALAGLGDAPGALASYERSLDLARQTGNRRLQGMALGYMGYISKALGEVQRSVDYGEQAVAIARQIGDRRFVSWFLQSLGAAYLYLGDEDRAIAQFDEALRIGGEISSEENQMWAHLSLSEAYWRKGEGQPALDQAHQGLEAAKKLGHRWGQAQAFGELAAACSLTGDFNQALGAATEGLALARAINVRSAEALCLREQARALLELGRPAEAHAPLQQALELGRAVRDRSAEIDALTLLAQLAEAEGDTATAREHLTAALQIQQATGTRYAAVTQAELDRLAA